MSVENSNDTIGNRTRHLPSGNGMHRNHQFFVHKTTIKFIELLSCSMFRSYTRITIRLANYEIS